MASLALKTDRVFSFALLLMAVSTSKNPYFEKMYAFLLMTVGFVTGYAIARNFSTLNSRIYLMDNVVFFIAVLFVMNILFISSGNRRRLRRIFVCLLRDRQNRQFSRLTDKYLRSYFILVGCLCLGSLLFMNSLPILVAVMEEEKRGSMMTLLFPCWFPWKVDSTGKYLLTIGLQFTIGGLLYSVVLGEIMFLICCMALVKAHNEFFHLLAVSFDERVDFMVLLKSPEVTQTQLSALRVELEETMADRYRYLIWHYQRVHRNINNIAHCCGFYSSNSLLIFLGGFIFCSVILLEHDNQSHIIYKTKILSGELLSYQFVVFSYFGETIIELNDNFRQTMYNTKWYERSPTLRRTIMIFMQLTNVPIKMSAFHMYTIKLGLLTYILKTCFSLIQLLSKV